MAGDGRMRRRGPIAPCLLVAAAIGLAPAFDAAAAAATPGSPPDAAGLLDLPIADLMDIKVTSVAKKAPRLGYAAAAIYVITQEDIRRSGMNSIPDLLRMVPGLDVAQVNSHLWSVASRGFAGVTSSKLLVLVDGRSVYSLIAGVLWDEQAMPLQNIERIEIIRGPGATIWGANAMNGVINIISKNPGETQGLTARAVGGTAGAGSVSVRQGGRLGDKIAYSVFVYALDYPTLARQPRDDSAVQTRAGGQADWAASPRDTVSVQGQAFQERSRDVLFLPSLVAAPIGVPAVQHDSGGDAQLGWSHRFSATADLTLKAYFDTVTATVFTTTGTVHTYDIDMVDRFSLGAHDQVIWGAGYRQIDYTSIVNPQIQLTPPAGGQTVFNTFAQNEFALTNDLHLIAGVKFEHNSYTGWEIEPSAQLLWNPSERHTLWAAVSRAVRTPSVNEEGGSFEVSATPASGSVPPILVAIFGNPGGQLSERLTSWEAGYRGTLSSRIHLDVAAFYNQYDHLVSVAGEAPVFELVPSPPHLLLPQFYGNLLKGDTYGGEVSGNWQVTAAWLLSASYSLLLGGLTSNDPNLIAALQPNNLDLSPRHQFQVRSRLDLPWRTQLDAAVYEVGALPGAGVPAYTRLDLRFGWRPTARLAFSLAGQNLLQDRHLEFSPAPYAIAREVPRTINLAASVAF